jgi:hypothetical protein
MQQGSLPKLLSAESATTAAAQMQRHGTSAASHGVVWSGAAWRGMRHSTQMPRLLRRCVAHLHTPQICGTCRGIKVGIHGLLNWTAENLYLGTFGSIMRQTVILLFCNNLKCKDSETI